MGIWSRIRKIQAAQRNIDWSPTTPAWGRQGVTKGTPTRQTYKFGWIFAFLSFHIAYWAYVESSYNPYFNSFHSVMSLVQGVAAVSVRPWGWYVLVFSFPINLPIALYDGLTHGTHAILFLPSSVIFHVLSFVYFYKRRAMFCATRRWRWLERWCPTIAGPEVSTKPGVSLRWLHRKWRYKRWRHLSRLSTYLVAVSCPPAYFVRRGQWAAFILVGLVWILGAGLVGVGIVLLSGVALAIIPLTEGPVLSLYTGLFLWLLSAVFALVLWPSEAKAPSQPSAANLDDTNDDPAHEDR